MMERLRQKHTAHIYANNKMRKKSNNKQHKTNVLRSDWHIQIRISTRTHAHTKLCTEIIRTIHYSNEYDTDKY